MLLTGFVYSLTPGSLSSDNVSVFHCVYFPPLLFGSGYEASIFLLLSMFFPCYLKEILPFLVKKLCPEIYDVLTNFSLTALGIRSWQFY